MAITAARIDEQGLYQAVDSLDSEADLTPLHLPLIPECDLAPGKYRWIASDNPANRYGGAFWPVAWLEKISPVERDALAHQ